MSTKSRIDYLQANQRIALSAVEDYDREIGAIVRRRNEAKSAAAELEGRVAYLDGRKKARCPHRAPLLQYWNAGWMAERRESLESLMDIAIE